MNWQRTSVECNGVDVTMWVSPDGKKLGHLPEWGAVELIDQRDELQAENEELRRDRAVAVEGLVESCKEVVDLQKQRDELRKSCGIIGSLGKNALSQLQDAKAELNELREALQRCEKDHRDDVATMTRQLLSFETMWDALRTLANRKNYFDSTFDAPAIALAAIDAARGGSHE